MREHYTGFIVRHEVSWELAMAGLALVWVAVGFAVDQAGPGSRPDLEAVELALTAVFVAEFSSRILAAHDRAAYLRGHLVDLIALTPTVPAIRLLRLLRLVRLVRAFASLYRAAMHVQRLASHRGFAWLLVAWLALMVICSAVVYAAEHGGAGSLISNPFDALWWGISTISTVAYGDTYPVTTEGRIAAMVLMLLGVGLFSAITASITSYLIAQDGAATAGPANVVDRLERLNALRRDGALNETEFAAAKALALGR